MIITMIKTLFNCVAIFFLLIVIGILLSLFIPSIGKSLNNYEYKKRKIEEQNYILEKVIK